MAVENDVIIDIFVDFFAEASDTRKENQLSLTFKAMITR